MKKILSLVMAFGLLCQPCWGVTNQWRNTGSYETIRGTISVSDVDAESYANIVVPTERLLSKYKRGCDIQYLSAATLTVTAGECMLSNSAGTARLMQQNTPATTVTWANIDTGAEETAKTYYVYAYQNTTSTFTWSVLVSTSSSAPTGGTYFLKLGTFYNNADGDIEQITNEGKDVPADVHIRGWVVFGSTGTIADSYNVSSVAHDSTGEYTITWDTDFSSAVYCCVVSTEDPGFSVVNAYAVGSVHVTTYNTAYTDVANHDTICLIALGAQ